MVRELALGLCPPLNAPRAPSHSALPVRSDTRVHPRNHLIDRTRAVQIGVKSRFVGYGDGAACTVESLVLQHLSQIEEGGWAGWRCEGSPVRGLWALLMWDVLFMDVPEVFQVNIASGPDTAKLETHSVWLVLARLASPVLGVRFKSVLSHFERNRNGSIIP